jgi:hypothetical protein
MHGARNTPVPAPPHVTRGFSRIGIPFARLAFRRICSSATHATEQVRRAVAGGVGKPRRECDGRRLKMGRVVGMDPAGRWSDRPIPASAARDPDGGRKDVCHWHRNGTTVPISSRLVRFGPFGHFAQDRRRAAHRVENDGDVGSPLRLVHPLPQVATIAANPAGAGQVVVQRMAARTAGWAGHLMPP